MTKILLSLLLLAPYAAHSAEFVGLIKSIAVGPQLSGGADNTKSTVLIQVVNHSTDSNWSSECSSNTFWSYKFDSEGNAGKETYSLLLAAYTSGKKVVMLGTGECSGDRATDIQNLYYTRFY